MADIERNLNLSFMLRDIAAAVDGLREEGPYRLPALRRCTVAKPPTAAIAYALKFGIPLTAATETVHEALPEASPNVSFRGALTRPASV